MYRNYRIILLTPSPYTVTQNNFAEREITVKILVNDVKLYISGMVHRWRTSPISFDYCLREAVLKQYIIARNHITPFPRH